MACLLVEANSNILNQYSHAYLFFEYISLSYCKKKKKKKNKSESIIKVKD